MVFFSIGLFLYKYIWILSRLRGDDPDVDTAFEIVQQEVCIACAVCGMT